MTDKIKWQWLTGTAEIAPPKMGDRNPKWRSVCRLRSNRNGHWAIAGTGGDTWGAGAEF